MKTMSAFRPVLDSYLYQTIDSESMSEKSFEKSDSSRVTKKPRKERKKFNMRWSMDLKIRAVHEAKRIGVSKAVAYLQKQYFDEYKCLSISTLKYWVEQSNGRKKRYYE